MRKSNRNRRTERRSTSATKSAVENPAATHANEVDCLLELIVNSPVNAVNELTGAALERLTGKPCSAQIVDMYLSAVKELVTRFHATFTGQLLNGRPVR